MNLAEMMKENEIELEWLFTLAKLRNKEGLMYFNPVTEEIDEQEFTNLDPKCFIIDGEKFVYEGDKNDDDIMINSIDNVVTFTRIDGIQMNIDTTQLEGFPFRVEQFKDTPFQVAQEEVPEDFVEVSE